MSLNLYKKKIKHCYCGSSKFFKNIDFGNIPLNINNYNCKKKVDKKRVIITICKNCNLVQLRNSSNKKKLFPKNYSYHSGDSKEKIKNFKSILDEIKKINPSFSLKIIDVGSNDNSFINLSKKKYYHTYGIEPTDAYKINNFYKCKIFDNFLNYNFAKKINLKLDFIVACNILGHTEDVSQLLRGIKFLIKNNGYIIIEVQYLILLFDNFGFDSFHHEHVNYFTLETLSKMLLKYGIFIKNAKILKVHGGILRVVATTNQFSKTHLSINKIINSEKKINIIQEIYNLNKFRLKFNININKLLNKIIKKKKIIYGIGAAPRACALINSANINKRQIKYIGEVASSAKCGKYIPGTKISVINENILLKKKPDYFFIFSWHLACSLIRNYKKIGYKGKFIIPLPKIFIKN